MRRSRFDPAQPFLCLRWRPLWRLVDVFVIVDESKDPVHISDTMRYVEIPEIVAIEFLNKDVIYQSVTEFDPVPSI